MKKQIYVIAGVVTVVGIGYFIYRKYRRPNVTLNSISWDDGWATMTIDGDVTKVTAGIAVMLGRGYSVEMETGVRGDSQKNGAVNLVLKKDGEIVELIDYYHQ